jgi:hypothetical protein
MAKNKISDYSSTASQNTDIGNININEGCAPSNINNAIRELMAQIKDFQQGADGDGLTVSTLNATTATLGSLVVSSFGAITATSLNVSGESILASASISGNLTTATANITTATIGAVQGTSATLTNPLPIASGGTALTTLTAENVILGNGTSAPKFVAPGTSGNVLTSNGTTWTSAAAPAGYVGPNAQVFTANGTFTIPTGITKLKVTVVGGGAGGNPSSGAGGNSSVASGTESITTITGNGGSGQSGGSASNGDVNLVGGAGGPSYFFSTNINIPGSIGGSSALGGGGQAGSAGSSFGGGGGGASVLTGCGGGNGNIGGGAGGTAIKWLSSLTPGNTLSVTIGAGGSTSGGGAGGAGGVIFEW